MCYLEVADVCYHVCEERVACNVEWDTQSLCVCVCVCVCVLDILEVIKKVVAIATRWYTHHVRRALVELA